MNDDIHTNLDKLFNEELINKRAKDAHQKILEKIAKEADELKKEVDEIKKRNNETFTNLAKGLVFTIGNTEVCT